MRDVDWEWWGLGWLLRYSPHIRLERQNDVEVPRLEKAEAEATEGWWGVECIGVEDGKHTKRSLVKRIQERLSMFFETFWGRLRSKEDKRLSVSTANSLADEAHTRKGRKEERA